METPRSTGRGGVRQRPQEAGPAWPHSSQQLRPRSQTAGTPKLKLARAPPTQPSIADPGDATPAPVAQAGLGGTTPGRSLTPPARPTRTPNPPLRGPRLEGAAGGGDSGRPRRSASGWAPGPQSAGRGRGGEAGVRTRGDRKGPPPRGAEGRAGRGRRLRTPHAGTARWGPAALTHLPRTRRRSWLLSARFLRRRLPGDVAATTATAGPDKR